MLVLYTSQVFIQHSDVNHGLTNSNYIISSPIPTPIITFISAIFNICMGTNTSKIKDIIYVSGASLDPPDLHKIEKQTSIKDMRIDYTKFIPKKFYKEDASEEEIEKHLQKVNKKQNILKQFKHYLDFDRMDFKRMRDQAVTFEIFAQEMIKLSLALTLLFTRIITVQLFIDYFTISSMLRMYVPALLTAMPAVFLRIVSTPQYHIVNHQFFRLLPEQVAMYAEFDQKLSLYKDVPDTKFNFKYHPARQYYRTRRNILETEQLKKKSLYKQCFLYDVGLKLDPIEEFAKSREKKRNGNWDILTEQQKKVIQIQLQERQASHKLQ